MKPSFILLLISILLFGFFTSALADNSNNSPLDAPGDIEIEVAFTKGSATSPSIIYVIWIENETENYIQNLFVCNKLIYGGLTGTALPYWKMNKYPDSEVDGVTGATQKNTDFDVDGTLADNSIRQFTVFFEVDHSWDDNDWFYDQPALLYSTDIDLDNLQPTYTMLPVGWTRNDNTSGSTSNVFKDDPPHTSPPIGELQSELRYITHQMDGTDFGDEYTDNTAATNIVESLVATITIAADETPPTIPENLNGTVVSSSNIELSWTASTDDVGVTAYRIYRNGNSEYFATSETNSYSDEGLTANTPYSYAVSAYDAAGNESEQSDTIEMTTLNETDVIISNQVFEASVDTCFGAIQDIIIGTTEFQSASSVNLIAGQSIRLLSGTYIHEGAYLNAYITTDDTYCDPVQPIVSAYPSNIKSIVDFNRVDELEENLLQKSIKVYPNPNNGMFTVKVEGFDQPAQIVIYNSLGIVVCKEKINSESFIDIGKIKRGLYFLKVTNSKDILTQKILVR